jgi:hypothetical protein
MHSAAFFAFKVCSDSKRVKTLIPLMGDFAHVSSDLPACAFSLHARCAPTRVRIRSLFGSMDGGGLTDAEREDVVGESN